MERAGGASIREEACALGGGLTRRVLVEGPPYIELRIEGAAARKERVGQLNGREAATSDIGCGLGYGEFIGFSHGALSLGLGFVGLEGVFHGFGRRI